MIDQVGRSIPAAVQSWWSWVKLELFKYIVIHSIIAESDGACLLPGSEYNYRYLCQHISLNIDTRNWSSDVLFWFEGWPWDHDSDWAILNEWDKKCKIPSRTGLLMLVLPSNWWLVLVPVLLLLIRTIPIFSLPVHGHKMVQLQVFTGDCPNTQ